MLLGVNVCFTNNRKIPYLIEVNANSPRVSSYIKLKQHHLTCIIHPNSLIDPSYLVAWRKSVTESPREIPISKRTIFRNESLQNVSKIISKKELSTDGSTSLTAFGAKVTLNVMKSRLPKNKYQGILRIVCKVRLVQYFVLLEILLTVTL